MTMQRRAALFLLAAALALAAVPSCTASKQDAWQRSEAPLTVKHLANEEHFFVQLATGEVDTRRTPAFHEEASTAAAATRRAGKHRYAGDYEQYMVSGGAAAHAHTQAHATVARVPF